MDYLSIDGIDITPYIAERGLKWSKTAVEGQNGGAMLDGSTTRDLIAQKVTLEIEFIAMESTRLQQLLSLFQREYFTVRYSDPLSGVRSMQASTQRTPASIVIRRVGGTTYWDGVSVTIQER